MTDSVFGFHAPRVCRVRGEQLAAEDLIVQAADAFRADDENVVMDAEHLRQGALALPAVVAAAGAMVVLGEPGAGKTSVLKQLTNGLPHVLDTWSRDSDACLWVTGGDLTEHSYQEELGSHLLSLPSEGETAEGAGVLTVVLDQADESPLLPRLSRSLRRSLSGRDTNRVRFLMACRTADYRAALTSALAEAFGACRCVDLAPLSRAEAVALADSAGVPGEDLVVAAESAGAAVLAGVPLTLELLVLTYQTDGQLHGRPEELFARGVARLGEDPDPRRLKKPLITTAHQRLTVAGRIAAWMLLSGHRTVWRGASFEAGTYDLQGDVLAGGTERTDAGPFEISPQVVEECFATALFTAPDDDRVAFRHSSVAAYLAARYLTDRKITQRQLENLFLICAPDGETATIPAPLRETAAWLVAMNPSGGDWLASADPESLAVHSALVRSDEVRRLTVSRLLERAAQIELGDTRWQLSRWDLRHPALAHQLADNLELGPAEGAASWQSTARIRLAIQLAQEAGTNHPRLADALVRLVQNDTWHQTERRLAARAAFACDPGRAVPVFVEVLATLSEPPDAKRVDPDHELRGTLLSLLWPHHLDAATMLGALRPPSPDLYGNYAHFLRTMPGECRDEDLPSLLAWASDAVCRPDSGYVFSHDRFEISLINGVIDRAMKMSEASQHADTLAKMIFGLLHNHHKVQLPDCLQPDEHGDETQETRSRRRLLTEALVREAVRANLDPRTAAYQIAYDWERRPSLRLDAPSEPEPVTRHHLVDREDFPWVLEQTVKAAGDGDGAATQVYGELASWTFPTDDPHVFELAYDEMHPAWPYLRSFYAAIRVDSPLAQSLRHNYSAGRAHWPEAAAFMAQQTRLLAEARAGDNDSLWQFLWGLRFDPQTGDFSQDALGSLSSWPAAIALGDDLSDLAELARRYLTTEHDRADSWLPHARRNKCSWAGYALLTELHRTNPLLEFPAGIWSSWAAAILTEYMGMSTSYMEPVRVNLLRLAARHAPGSVALRVSQVARAALTAGRQPIELNAIDPRWAPELRTCLEDLATEISTCLGLASEAAERTLAGSPGNTDHLTRLPNNDEAREAALRTWHSALAALLTTDSRVVHEIIDASIDGPRETPLAVRAAVLAAHALLTTDAEAHWSRAKAVAATDLELGRKLAEACARTEAERIQASLSEALVSDLYSWLSGLYDPEEDEPLRGVGWITDEQQVRRWRDRLLTELSRRGTAEAIRQLRQLATLYPSRLSIAAALVEATKQHAVASWSQVRTEDVVRLLQDPALRIIRTSTDLLDVVHEVLEEVGRELPSHCELLWDRTPGKRPRRPSLENPLIPDVWRPKPEAALCAYLAHELLLRLAGRRVAVNREVLIHPTDPYGAGDRTDLLVEAMPSPGDDPNITASGSVKLVIEVKGSWNDEVPTSQVQQLAGRYLPEAGTDVGIYIVGWYPIELWDATGDNRKTQAKKLQLDTLLVHLLDQAASLSQAGGVHVRPMVINIPRPDREKV
ncbi:hypothetical protein ABZ941_19295 [Streptomyces rubiginosohelvolus]|uniref:hypothetical protein n=1 Tax=Streptomyces rubiginosohelvolus TaxID=67362 RepID=UPI0033E9F8A3